MQKIRSKYICIPKTFNNTTKACFSNVQIQTGTMNRRLYIFRSKTSFNRILKYYLSTKSIAYMFLYSFSV